MSVEEQAQQETNKKADGKQRSFVIFRIRKDGCSLGCA
jgi:hypothetical protein